MAKTYIDRRTGQVYRVGQDYGQNRRTFIGGDTAIIGGDMSILGQDGSQMGLEEQVIAARAAGGFVAGDKSVVPVGLFQILPFSADVENGAQVSILLRPQRDFRCDNLVITSPEGPFFELSAWTVGRDSMLIAGGSVNCAAFSEGAAQKGLALRGYTANQGTDIELVFANTDTGEGSHRLSGMLSGPALMRIG